MRLNGAIEAGIPGAREKRNSLFSRLMDEGIFEAVTRYKIEYTREIEDIRFQAATRGGVTPIQKARLDQYGVDCDWKKLGIATESAK